MTKKILSTLLLASLLSSNILLAQNLVFAEEQTNTTEEIVVPKKIENEIFASIVQVYGEKRAKEIYERVMQIAKESIDKRSETLKNEDLTRAKSLGYKDKVTWETIQNPYIPDGMIRQQQEQAASRQAYNDILLNMQHMIPKNNKVDENNEH